MYSGVNECTDSYKINADVRSSDCAHTQCQSPTQAPSLTDCIPFLVYVWTRRKRYLNHRRTRVDENIYVRQGYRVPFEHL